MTLANTSCATLFGGKRTEYQQTKPMDGQPSRQIRPIALVGDILLFFPIGFVVDFLNGAIYKPQNTLASNGGGNYREPTPATVTRPLAAVPQRAVAPAPQKAAARKAAPPRKRQ